MLQADKNIVVSGNYIIGMNSIINLDVTDKDNNQKLVGHLKSKDFFSVDKHPKATFKNTKISLVKVAQAGKANATVNDLLTIIRINKQVSFTAVVNVPGKSIKAKSGAITFVLNKRYIFYGSKSILYNINDKASNRNFALQYKLAAKK